MMAVGNMEFQGLFRVVTSKHFLFQSCAFTLTYAYIVELPPSPSATAPAEVFEKVTNDINSAVAALLTPTEFQLYGPPIGSAVISCNFLNQEAKDITKILYDVLQAGILANNVTMCKQIKRLALDMRPSGVRIYTDIGAETRRCYCNTGQLIDTLDGINFRLMQTTDFENYSFAYGKNVYTVYFRTARVLMILGDDLRTRHAVEQWLPSSEYLNFAIKGSWAMSKKSLKTARPLLLTDWDLWKLRNIRPVSLYIQNGFPLFRDVIIN